MEFLKGKKTYLVAVAAGVCVAAQMLGVHIPDFVWEFLGVTGAITMRSAIGNVNQ